VILIVVVNLDDVADLATKRRSSVAAEDDHQWSRAGTFPQVEVVLAVQCEEPRVGGIVPGVQLTAVHVGKCVAEHVEGVLRTACHEEKAHKPSKEENSEDYN
jgi:hypothetical protein